MKKILLTCALVLGLPYHTAFAEELCGSYPELKKHLVTKYKEEQVFVGVHGNGVAIVEVWVSKEGTYTIFSYNPARGSACIISTGSNYILNAIQIKGERL